MARNMGRIYHSMEEHVKKKHPEDYQSLILDMLELRQLGIISAEIVSLKT
jgi:hypothetical protein